MVLIRIIILTYGHRDADTDTFSLCPFDTATRPVVGLSNYNRTATRQELCRVHSEIAACGAGWVAVSTVSAQVDTDPMFQHVCSKPLGVRGITGIPVYHGAVVWRYVPRYTCPRTGTLGNFRKTPEYYVYGHDTSFAHLRRCIKYRIQVIR